MSDMWLFLTNLLWNLTIVLLIGEILSVIILIFVNIFNGYFLVGRKMAKVMEKGHSVLAVKIRSDRYISLKPQIFDFPYSNLVKVLYEYEYNGVKYNYYSFSDDYNNDELVLYFSRNPAKAKELRDFCGINDIVRKVIIILCIVIVFFIWYKYFI